MGQTQPCWTPCPVLAGVGDTGRGVSVAGRGSRGLKRQKRKHIVWGVGRSREDVTESAGTFKTTPSVLGGLGWKTRGLGRGRATGAALRGGGSQPAIFPWDGGMRQSRTRGRWRGTGKPPPARAGPHPRPPRADVQRHEPADRAQGEGPAAHRPPAAVGQLRRGALRGLAAQQHVPSPRAAQSDG